MAAVEGALRIKSIGKWITLIGIVIILIGILAIVGMHFVPDVNASVPILLVVAYFGVLPAFLGGVTWASGWIVEGFMQRQSNTIEKS